MNPEPPVVTLSLYRDYVCHRVGACCSSGWTIPLEAPVYSRLGQAERSGTLIVSGPLAGATLLRFPVPSGEYAGLLATDEAGRCAFFERSAEEPPATAGLGSCAVQRQLGHAALPAACRQFPRVAVLRPSSTAVSLSHYCPTAAMLLFREDAPLVIEAHTPAFPAGRQYDGLDARQALPPLLRADALFSWTAFDQWERFVVSVLADGTVSLGVALDRIVAAAEALREWTVARGDFDEWTARCLDEARSVKGPESGTACPARASLAYHLAAAAVPWGLRVAPSVSGLEALWERHVAEYWPGAELAVRRYLAGRAWASWIGHDGAGIRSHVRWLRVVLGVLCLEVARGVSNGRPFDRGILVDAIRRADLLLVHLISPPALARTLATAEPCDLRDPEDRAFRHPGRADQHAANASW